MTNKDINDATRDLVTWFRKWRDKRPLNKADTVTAYDELSDVIDAYSRYTDAGEATNQWVCDLGCAWLRELQTPEETSGALIREWLNERKAV